MIFQEQETVKRFNYAIVSPPFIEGARWLIFWIGIFLKLKYEQGD